MLVLERSRGKSIMIGDNIKVTVTQLGRKHVSLEIEKSGKKTSWTGKNRGHCQIDKGIDLYVTEIAFHNKEVHLGIEAPKDFKILRKELYDKKTTPQSPATNTKSKKQKTKNVPRPKSRSLKDIVATVTKDGPRPKPTFFVTSSKIDQGFTINDGEVRITLKNIFAEQSEATLEIELQHDYETHPVTDLLNKQEKKHQDSVKKLTQDGRIKINGSSLTVTLKTQETFYLSETFNIGLNKVQPSAARISISALPQNKIARLELSEN